MINIHILFVALPNEYLKKNLICTSEQQQQQQNCCPNLQVSEHCTMSEE